MTPTFRIAAIAGDGIGKEVLPEGLRVAKAAAERFGFELEIREIEWASCDWYAKHGQMMPDDWKHQLEGVDAIYFGAVGWPAVVADNVSLWDSLLKFRREFDQYINLRPVRLFEGVPCPLAGRKPGDIDYLVVRENTEQGEFALHFTSEFTPRQTEIAHANMGQFLSEALKNDHIVITTATDSTQLESALFEALPDVTQLGKITQHIALRFAGEKEKKIGNVELSELEISTRDYGITGSGKASMSEGQMLPAAQAELTCKNCIAMIDVLSAYLTRVESAAVVLAPENAGRIAFTPAQTQGIKQLLLAVGTPPVAGPNDLQFVIKSNAGAVSINGKSLPELLQLVQQYLSEPTP